MGRFNIKKSFSQKKFKYGGYATLLTVIVISIIVAFNLILVQLDNKFNLKLDLTKNKIYSLSDQSYNVLSKLNKDVTITGLYTKGKESQAVSEILNKYKNGSKKITLEYKDPLLSGSALSKYSADGTSLQEGTVIIQSGNKYKVVSPTDFYNYTTSSDTGEQVADSLAIEQKITAGIIYVTSSNSPVIYTLQGQSEAALPAELTSQLSNENYTVNSLNFLTGTEWKPNTNDILMIISPQTDITSDELTKIKAFLSKGGRGLFILDTVTDKMSNFKALLNYNAVDVSSAVVFEGNANNYTLQTPYVLVPDMQSQDIMKTLIAKNLPVVFPIAHPLTESKLKKSSQTVEALLSSTKDSWSKINTSGNTLEKETGDAAGPFNIAVAVTDSMDSTDITKMSKVVVLSSSQFIASQLLQESSIGNMDFFMNSLTWLTDQKDNLSIRPKSLNSETLNITSEGQVLLLSGLVVIVIPVTVLTVGFVVWFRRRNL